LPAAGKVARERAGATVEKRALGFFDWIARRVMRVTPREVSIVCAGWGGGEAERDVLERKTKLPTECIGAPALWRSQIQTPHSLDEPMTIGSSGNGRIFLKVGRAEE